MNRTTLIAGFVLLVGTMGIAQAAEFSGNVAYTIDYRFRGISQTDEDMAVQGGFDIDIGNGFYAGTWASNVQFGGSIEIDWYAGYAGEVNDDLSYDVGYMYYSYPSDNSDPDYHEIYGSVSYMGGTLGLVYSPDYFAETDAFIYVYGDYSFAVNEQISLDFHLGWNKFDDDDAFASFLGAGGAGSDYIDYSVGASTSQLGLDFALAYVGSDVDDDACGDICDGAIILSVSKSL